jgi:5'-3' exonuclease
VLAVDAPSMLFRAFYALPKSIKGPDGKPVNALLGTANLILREVEKHDPRAVVLCFGPDAAAYRLELYPDYHADREAAFPDELGPQWEDSADFFGAFGWTIAGSENLEADDILNSYALKEEKAGGRSLLMTGDRDMFQCASGSTKVLYVSTGKQGDPSDGIPGAKGVGEKTAVELLRKHGSLEKVLAAAIREPRPALRTALTGDRDLLLAFKDMAKLRTQKVGRPRDKRTDYRGAAKAARGRGMNRLAERLEGMAR